MVFYEAGSAATGLINNTTYFIDEFFQSGVNTYKFTLKPLPSGAVITSISGGTGTQTFKQIGISLDKDIFHVKDHGFTANEMLEYEFPAGGRFGVSDPEQIKNFYFIQTLYDAHNFTVNQTTGDLTPKTLTRSQDRGVTITPTTVTPVGLTAPIVYSILSGALPTGLSFSTSTGVITGTPVEVIASPGREVTIKATDTFGSEGFQTVTFIVNATVGSIEPATQSRENIFAGTAITPTVITSTPNLVAPLTWAISSGTLPTGLALNTSNGTVSGTPSEVIGAPGRQVVVRATDVGGLTGFQTHTYQINPRPELYAFTSATFTPGGQTGETGPSIAQARSGVGAPGWANTYLNMSGQAGILQWTVPATATYRIDAYGAIGGDSTGATSAFSFQRGGYGARICGDFALTEGTVLKLLIGQRGRETTHSQDGRSVCSGGGMTAVTRTDNSILVVAGGGGGSASNSWTQQRGGDAQAQNNGGSGPNGQGGAGSGGNGGTGSTTGAGGAGFFGNGQAGNASGDPARSYTNGGRGGQSSQPTWGGGNVNGGFGGGAGGGGLAGGGGGGYSGGAAGEWSSSQSGGGGGSANNGSNQINTAAAHTGVGQIIITKL
jgi:hypothetical protein